MVNRSRALAFFAAASLSTAVLCAAAPTLIGGAAAAYATVEAGSFSPTAGQTSTEHPAVRDVAPSAAKFAPMLLL